MKIAFVLNNYNANGGIEKALESILHTLCKNDVHDITVLCLKDKVKNTVSREIPDSVKIKQLEWYPQYLKDTQTAIFKLLKKYLLSAPIFSAGIILAKIYSRLRKCPNIYHRYLLKRYPAVPGEFNIAIAFEYPPCNILYVTKDKIKADKTYLWIHFEPFMLLSKQMLKYDIELADKIISVSDAIKNDIADNFPEYNTRFYSIYNMVDANILTKANEKVLHKYTDNKIRLLTVARLTSQKGIDIAVDVTLSLIKDKYEFEWFIIGEGELRQEIEKLISEHDIDKYFKLLGNIENPYPYIKDCDIYVQPSRYEGYGIALAEARVLCKPIVTTDFYGAREQITNRHTGSIVNCNVTEISNAIKELCDDVTLRKLYVQNLKKENNIYSAETDLYNILNI